MMNPREREREREREIVETVFVVNVVVAIAKHSSRERMVTRI